MYRIKFTEKANKQLLKLNHELQERILSSLDRIRIRPKSFIKKLEGNKYYSFRIGDYRLILDLNNDELIILVMKIGHRKNIYD